MGECAGNGTESARRAGYKGTPNALGVQANALLRNPKVRAMIDERVKADKRVLTREELQQFWTETVKDVGLEMRDRLSASKLLGQSRGEFIARVELDANVGGALKLYLPDNGRLKQDDDDAGDDAGDDEEVDEEVDEAETESAEESDA